MDKLNKIKFMNKIKIAGFIAGIACFCLNPVINASFEETGTGAQPLAMAGCFTAYTGSVYSLYYNPAGLGFIYNTQLVGEFSSLYQGLDDKSSLGKGCFAFAVPITKDYFGFGFAYDSLSLAETYSEDIIRFSAGYRILDPLSFGFELKLMSQKYMIVGNQYYAQDTLFTKGVGAGTMDMDFGLAYMPFDYLSVGLKLGNIFQSSTYLDEENKSKLPGLVRFGVKYSEYSSNMCLDLVNETYKFGSSLEGTESKSNMSANIGIEKFFLERAANNFFLAFRGGLVWGINNQSKSVTAGFGVNIAPIAIDYAWVFPISGIEDISGSHHFSFVCKFGKIKSNLKRKTSRFEQDDFEEPLAARENSLQRGNMPESPSTSSKYTLSGKTYVKGAYPEGMFSSQVLYGPVAMILDSESGTYNVPAPASTGTVQNFYVYSYQYTPPITAQTNPFLREYFETAKDSSVPVSLPVQEYSEIVFSTQTKNEKGAVLVSSVSPAEYNNEKSTTQVKEILLPGLQEKIPGVNLENSSENLPDSKKKLQVETGGVLPSVPLVVPVTVPVVLPSGVTSVEVPATTQNLQQKIKDSREIKGSLQNQSDNVNQKINESQVQLLSVPEDEIPEEIRREVEQSQQNGESMTDTAPAVIVPAAPAGGIPAALSTENGIKQKEETGQATKPKTSPGNYMRYHKVKPGDTLKSLAQDYYGNSDRWIDIYKINEDKIDKGSLRPGQTMIIP
ncbi:MAG: hypothetical protein A2252_11945 [Elusimicrobia bacterium RIFOXYA2_FULL_39_19]|nr:MAG: hypothetical protein A2252_11945 [Elusimicrobia bacterium RIFOXYA2_FULL_39_19]